MSLELGRRLLASGAVSPEQLQIALFAHLTEGMPFVRALMRHADVPASAIHAATLHTDMPALRRVRAEQCVVDRLPSGLCETLFALPIRVDPMTGTIDVAVADPLDPHIRAEFAFHLEAPIRVIHAPPDAIEEALRALEHLDLADLGSLEAASARPRAPTPPFGARVARSAMVPRKSASELPIPLVRRSHAPQPNSFRPPSHVPAGVREASDTPRTHDPSRAPSVSPADLLAHERPGHTGLPPMATPATPLPESVRSLSLDVALEALAQATSRDDVIDALLHGLHAVCALAAIFAVRRDELIGWACSPGLATPEHFRQLHVDRQAPTVLAHALAHGWYLGRIPQTLPDRPLFELLGDPSDEVAIVSIEVADRPIMVLLAARLADTMIATRTAERLASATADAMLRVLRADRAGEQGKHHGRT